MQKKRPSNTGKKSKSYTVWALLCNCCFCCVVPRHLEWHDGGWLKQTAAHCRVHPVVQRSVMSPTRAS